MGKPLCLISCRVPTGIAGGLSGLFEVTLLPPDPCLAAPVASHADMLLFRIGNAVFIHEKYAEVAGETVTRLRERGMTVITASGPRGEKYPFDVGLNCAVLGGALLCRKDSAAPEILSFCEARGVPAVNVRQGYAACSSLFFGNSAVTADPSVAVAAESLGAEVLRIRPGHIALSGYDTGFIGGASGVRGREIYFFGDVDAHPDGEKIRDFAAERGMECVCLGDGPLTDLGGMMVL